MPLRGDRLVKITDIAHTCNDVCVAGDVLVYGTAGSGAGLGDSAGTVTLSATSSGKIPAGLTLEKFVNIDQTQVHRNFHDGSHMLGEKAPLLRDGWVVTDRVEGTPTVGAPAYLSSSGVVKVTLDSVGGFAATPQVGEWMSIKDEDGFAKLYVKLPNRTR